jgi:hypothetical protein
VIVWEGRQTSSPKGDSAWFDKDQGCLGRQNPPITHELKRSAPRQMSQRLFASRRSVGIHRALGRRGAPRARDVRPQSPGRIWSNDTPTEIYTIQFQDFTTRCVRSNSSRGTVPDNLDDTWSDQTRAAVRSRIVSVWTQTTSTDIRVASTLLPDFPPRFREFLSTVGIRNDIQKASDLCACKTIVWEPKSAWIWKSSSVSNRADWMVQAKSCRVENGEVVIMLRTQLTSGRAPLR